MPAFIAMKMKKMLWSLYNSKGSWEKGVNIAGGVFICCNSFYAISMLSCAEREGLKLQLQLKT